MSSPSTAHETIARDQQIAGLPDLYAPVGPGVRSCCCSARPVMRVILPATA